MHGGNNLASAAAVQHEWASQLPALLAHANARELRMVGYGDLTSPLVLGACWVFPPRAASRLYQDGLSVLEAPWNATHGWNRSGTPRQLWSFTPQRYANGAVIADRRGVPRPTSKAHSWTDIDSGDLDQGFLLYMLYHRHAGAGAFMRGGGAHLLRHYVRGETASPGCTCSTPRGSLTQLRADGKASSWPVISNCCLVWRRGTHQRVRGYLSVYVPPWRRASM